MESDIKKNQDSQRSGRSTPPSVKVPRVEIPKGGGAVRGIGEKFSTNSATGSGVFSIPIELSEARTDLGLSLVLEYDSGNGNGPFGLGWKLDLPKITRKTDKGLPKYGDSNESDEFLISGAEDLVPVLSPAGDFKTAVEVLGGNEYQIQFYRPRTEGLFARIERWTRLSDGDIHWRTISKDNITSLFGLRGANETKFNSRIIDPRNPERIFEWLICQRFDCKGNAIEFSYLEENELGVDKGLAFESNRLPVDALANRYIKRIRYGNKNSLLSNDDVVPLLGPDLSGMSWAFEVVFDYGEGHVEAQGANSKGELVSASNSQNSLPTVRQDPFSRHRSGFEIRTYRRCSQILMFHQFPDELETPACLVKSVDLQYEETKFASILNSVTRSGYARQSDGLYLKKSFPPIEFEYSRSPLESFDPSIFSLQNLPLGSLENLPSGVTQSEFQWVDLDGEGISGVLAEFNGALYYKQNLGCEKLGSFQRVNSQPTLASVSEGSQRFMDLDGDGQLDLVDMSTALGGFFDRTSDDEWKPFRRFRQIPNLDFGNSRIRFGDLTGDGLSDVLLAEDDELTWYKSLGEEGFKLGGSNRILSDENNGPVLVHGDVRESVFLADMSGDGLSDFVRVRQGEVCYWPNLGYGKFGRKVTMANSPVYDFDDQFVPSRIYLADTDGTGTTDIVYHGAKGALIFLNYSGNSWSDGRLFESVPSAHQMSSLSTVDLLGNGTVCLVWSSALPGDSRKSMRYIDLMQGGKPYLLVKSENNLGAETHIDYLSSTQFYLEDKAKGRDWVTKLPFPVHVVSRVETLDRIAKNRFVTRYKYHHGYFDGFEREFRGFGLVEQWDTEEFASLSAGGHLSDAVSDCDANILQSSHSAPVLTKTWYHTGAYFNRQTMRDKLVQEYFHESTFSGAAFLGDSSIPIGISAYEEREACRALRGKMIRQEVYGVPEMKMEDLASLEGTFDYDCNCLAGSNDPDYWIPYSATEKRYNVKLLQPLGSNPHAVFFTHESESITKNYEPNQTPPKELVERENLHKIVVEKARVTHNLKLEVSEFGDELKSVSIAYPYRGPDPDRGAGSADPRRLLSSDDIDSFQKRAPIIVATDNEYTNLVSDIHSFRAPLIAQTSSFELTGYDLAARERYDASDFVSESFAWERNPSIADYAEEATGDRRHRLIERIRTIYRRDDLSSKLPFKAIESRALPFESYSLAFSPGLLSRQFNSSFQSLHGAIDVIELMNEAGYTQVAGDTENWWIPSGRQFYSPNPEHDQDTGAELAFAKQRGFFQPGRFRNPFHEKPASTETIVRFDDYALIVRETEDSLGNLVTAGERSEGQDTKWELDYRVLQPRLITDPNGNRKAVAYDALGMVTGTAVMGKLATGADREGDSLEGFEADLPVSVLESHFANPRVEPDEILVKATTRIAYDIHRYHRTKFDGNHIQASLVYTVLRESHVYQKGQATEQPTKYQHGFSYSDGFGREVQKKIQAENGPVPKRDINGQIELSAEGHPEFTSTTGARWVGTGWTVFNNKGDPVRQYEPFFTDRHSFEFDTRIGVSPILFYDPLGRMVAKLNPNKSWEKVVIDSWHQTNWDSNDTARITKVDGTTSRSPLDDPHVGRYFQKLKDDGQFDKSWIELRGAGSLLGPQEKLVAQKTMRHAGTPTTIHFDPLGREFVSVVHNRFGPDATPSNEFYKTLTRVDIEGNQLEVSSELSKPNAAGVIEFTDRRVVMQYKYDMLANRIFSFSMDAGKRWNIGDSLGSPLYKWDSRRQRFHYLYDRLRRHIATDLKNPRGEIQIEQFRYGDNDGIVDPHNQNLRLQICQINDQAGEIKNEQFDFKGNLLSSTRQLHINYQFAINLRNPNQARLGGRLYETSKSFDALERVTEEQAPDGSKIKNVYNDANLLEQVSAELADSAATTSFVKSVEYDAKGQRKLIEYGCGAITTYEYERETFRLTRMLTKRGRETIQDLNYTYDPVGNISYVKDAAQKTVFFRNRQVDADSDYEYDASYRLVKATGREHLGQRGGSIRHDNFDGRPQAHPNDGGQMVRYAESYAYDEVGNIQFIDHAESTGRRGWRRNYAYGSRSLIEPTKFNNRLTSTHSGVLENYNHDDHGNMTRMPHLSQIQWDHNDQILSSSRGDGKNTWYVYDYQGQRVRKVTAYYGTVTNTKDRIYVGSFEVYKEYELRGGPFNRVNVQVLERETLHVMDDEKRIAMFERRTRGSIGEARLIRYQISNHLGSSSIELKQDGEIISYEEYLPFGSTSYQGISIELIRSRKRYRYTGKERDEETGLYYYGARYYASWLGRWTTTDPIEIRDGINLYSFVSNSPTNFVDLEGTEATPATCDKLRCHIPKNSNENLDWNVNDFDYESFEKILQESQGEQNFTPLQADPDSIVLEQYEEVTEEYTDYVEVSEERRGGSSVAAGSVAISAGLLADDVSVIGVADDALIPVVLGIGFLTASVLWLTTSETVTRSKPVSRTRTRRRRKQLTYVSYKKTNPLTQEVYVGRTVGYGDPRSILSRRDLSHHKTKQGFGPARIDRSIPATLPHYARHLDPSYQAVRGREQQLIDFYGGAWSERGRFNTKSGNNIRGVAKQNPLGKIYHEAANLLFGQKYMYTGY